MEVCHNFLKECHIFLHDDWREACCCPYNLSWYSVLKTPIFWREQHVYPSKTFHISLRCTKPCQEDAVLLGDKMTSPVDQRCCFLLFMLCYKDTQHRNKHHSIVERGATGQNWTPFLFDIHWLNTIFHSIFLPNWICPADWRVWFQVLVVYFLPDVQTWMCTIYTQDLKPKIFTLYVPIIYI